MNDIWTQWEKYYKSLGLDPSQITKDGIISPNSYQNVLLVLKDSNNFPGGDLREHLANGPRGQTWHTAARWAAGILEGFPDHQNPLGP